MSRIGAVTALSLQESLEAERVREQMDGPNRGGSWRSLKERLGLKGIGCCGATWGVANSTISVRDDDDDGDHVPHQQNEVVDLGQAEPEQISDLGCVGQSPTVVGMNLAAALAAERHFRAAEGGAVQSPAEDGSGFNRPVTAGPVPGTPLRMSLLRLLEETDGADGEKGRGGGGTDTVCCVCMGRNKGAAFIPCGHTFCRVCSRELWLNRGSCPLCNRSILEILDLF